MPDPRDFRFLAHRVELGYHQRPNRFRRRAWLAGAVLSVLAVGWVALALGRGRNAHFSAGPVSMSHRMFENDCALCHTTWGPAERLVSLHADVSSISNDKCLKCHSAPPHQPKLDTALSAVGEISCAACHREHGHQRTLAEVADAFCIACHAELKAPEHGGSERFADKITSFEASNESGGHPEFAVHRLLKQTQAPSAAQHGSDDVVAWFLREDDRGTNLGVERWQDRSRIRFNHKLHLRPIDDAAQPVTGLRDGQGQLRDLSQRCETCHELDPAGRYLQPIRYERHCQECHPLRFDDQAFPGQTVPHQEPAIVRGFLIEQYSKPALEQARRRNFDPEPTAASGAIPYVPRLPMDVSEQLERQVDDVQLGMPVPLTAANAEHVLFGPEARGGCRYCHEIADPAQDRLWKIMKPRIPERWLEHSQFRHRSHRFLACRDCHAGVYGSFSTGDVLLPEIALCRNCHTPHPKWTPPGNGQGGAAQILLQGARTHCIECHDYHHAAAHGKQP